MASRGSGLHEHTKAAVECTSQAIWLLHSPKRDRKRFSRSTGAATSAASESSAPLHRCGDDGGRARRRALCTRWTRLMSQASPRAAKHARTHEYLMHHTALRHGRHARLMCLQAAARQWSSHRIDIYGCTSRGQLHMVVLHAVVQWFASVCCMCRPRAIARSTSHNACAARVVRG